MSIFKKIFGGSETNQGDTQVVSNTSHRNQRSAEPIKFGRYTDCNKNKEQLSYWSKALDQFKNKNYTDSFESLLHYIADKNVGNVVIKRSGDRVDFELTQGSKIIKGYGDSKDFKAEAAIVSMEETSVPVMRKLMTLNYALMYTKFAIKDSTFCMKFTSHALDASPNKIYFGLKELAKKADQQDDLLIQEFSSLKEIDTHNIIELSPEIQELRYNTLISKIKETKDYISTLDANAMSGGIAFLLLDLTYTLDYLIVPQGLITDSLEKIQHMFFAKDNQSTVQKNAKILDEFDKILTKPKADILAGIYDVKATFAIANPASHKTVMDFMFKEREKIGYYRDNNHHKIVEAVYGYMITYAYFNYGMVYPVTDLLNLCMHTLHHKYYKDSGSTLDLLDQNGNLIPKNLTSEINRIIGNAKGEYPHVMINTGALNFTSKAAFIDSLILQMDKMNLTKNA